MTTAGKTGQVLSHCRNVRKSQPSKPKITSTSTIPSTIGFFTSESKRISAKSGKLECSSARITSGGHLQRRAEAVSSLQAREAIVEPRRSDALPAFLGEELLHIVLVPLEGHQETAVVNARDAADPVFIFDNFPMSIWDFDAQVIGWKHIK
jgi:hypothetical protein